MIYQLETERLILKNYSENDLINIQKLKSEPLIWKFSDKKATTDIEESEKYLKSVLKTYSDNKCNFQALFLKDTAQYIGEAGVISYNSHNKRVVVGYNLLPSFWNKGFASEITKALIKYLFEEEKIERIEALTMEENYASRKVLEKSGFKQEGILRNFALINNEFHNICYYGMIKKDYF